MKKPKIRFPEFTETYIEWKELKKGLLQQMFV